MAYIDFITKVHTATKRNYVARMADPNRIKNAEASRQFGFDYWDGSRDTGYGGYHYDGRWRPVAERIAEHYGLKPGMKVLDVGCGKGFLLYELTQVVPGLEIAGIDISDYAIGHAKDEVKPFLQVAHAKKLPFADASFDLVISLNALHVLYLFDLFAALGEMERVSKKDKYLVVESYRNETEKTNLLCWQLTCECFFTPEEWEWIFAKAGYTGDYGLIYFE